MVVVDFSAVVVVSATARASRADRARTFSFMMKMEWNQPIKLFLKLNRSKGSDSILLTNGVGWGRGKERKERKST